MESIGVGEALAESAEYPWQQTQDRQQVESWGWGELELPTAGLFRAPHES
jgi:hypothetical protein